MYQIGDKIFYPMHGAGVVSNIEEKEILGMVQRYYILNLPHGNMDVMIPVDNSSKLGIRRIVDCNEVTNVLSHFKKKASPELSLHRNQRYRNNMEKLKSGNIYEGAEVIHELSSISKTKALSTVDKAMLNNAKQILISEIVLAKEIEQDQAHSLLDEVMN